ncbi:molecular chaperone DnaJ [Fimbriimonas ginsengisoli]|uniref:Chaperone protein DnaJ n=1 Tax=Fimbriimonas ginsengisoli Gsoil 348 TaxID=661478 RepID=A0A068NZ77_FIMGI|nr:molecular chaperone DnaJ [Fimbriimonas ginsengisoli]AIE88094.1 chaperone dnaJ [Fimbriimonas ginsengisoli Gsoil 348]
MAVKDPYEVLGVARGANADEIKSAYRRLARRHHPDVNPGDPSAEEKFKEVGEAYSILSDPLKRARFDQYGTTDDMPSDPFFGGGGGGNLNDLFDMFFGNMAGGGAPRGRRGRDGDDIRSDVELTLNEVIHGVRKEIEVTRMAECNSCHGTGVEGGGQPDTCPTCRGQGAVASVRNTFLGQVRTTSPCPTCGGTGTQIKNPCHECHGRMVVQETATVVVNIPPGVESGATMQVPGQGSDGVGEGRQGDLYVVLHVKEDSRFDRRGQTLISRLNISFAQAALGDQLQIEGVDETVDVNIAAGTQPGTQITVKGAGLPPLHGGRRGDMIVLVQVKVPTRLSEAEVKLIRELAELSGDSVPKGEDRGGILGGLFGKKK